MKRILSLILFLSYVCASLTGCGSSHTHKWVEASCIAPKHCEECGQTIGESIGHDWKDATCTEPKTCSICGETEGSSLGHNWVDATCTEPKKCSRCGVTDGVALGHSFTDGKCSRCGAADPDYTPPESYENNRYYDIVDEAIIKNSIGYTVVIQKVVAKQNCSIEATWLAFDTNGDVIGKSSDSITLTEGKPNYFRFSFVNDISKANIQTSWKYKEDSFMVGERNAVEMVKYNQSGRYLYITFKQISDEIGTFAKFKLLFYKDNKIVDCDNGYFSTYAKNLNGKGSTDVASIWIYGIEYDKIEYIFEP